MSSAQKRRRRIIVWWLAVIFACVCGMVILGGLTRLTGSGLSMVEWRPLMGTLPPLTAAEWERVFRLYQDTPQYELVNHWMDVDAFRRIFWLEYFHRLLGRSIGVIVILPWLFFLIRGWFDRQLVFRTTTMVLLGAAQGGMGWFMVMSGLVDVPEVSHLRLAAHLMLALLIAMWVLWTALDVYGTPPGASQGAGRNSVRLRRMAWGLVGLLALQCTYGAFMAGLRAGVLFATFPDLNGSYSPAPFFGPDPGISDLVSNPAVVHYVHRLIAWTVLGYSLYVAWTLRRAKHRAVAATAWALSAVACAQFGLGVATVVLSVPVGLASLHQGGAVVLLSLAVTLTWMLRRDP